jgi:hypothetical protein
METKRAIETPLLPPLNGQIGQERGLPPSNAQISSFI